ncbi:hypothetical protein QIS74_02498 [Colletotrichum tabaci]
MAPPPAPLPRTPGQPTVPGPAGGLPARRSAAALAAAEQPGTGTGSGGKRAARGPLSQVSSNNTEQRRPGKKPRTTAGLGDSLASAPPGSENRGSGASDGGTMDWRRASLRSEQARQAAEADPLKLAAFRVYVPADEHPDRDGDAPMDDGLEYSPLPVQLFQGLLAHPRLEPGSKREPSEYQLETVLGRIRAHGVPCSMRSHYLTIPAPAGYSPGACSIRFPVTLHDEQGFYNFIHDLCFAGLPALGLIEEGSPSSPLVVILRRAHASAPPRRTLDDLLGPAEASAEASAEDLPGLVGPAEQEKPIASRERSASGPERGGGGRRTRAETPLHPPVAPPPPPPPPPPPSGPLAAQRTPLPSSAGKDNPTPGPSRPAATGSFDRPIAIGNTPTPEPPGSPSASAGNDDEVDIVTYDDVDEEEGARRIVEAAKSGRAMNDIIRTPDDPAFWHNTADYFHLPHENYSWDNGTTLLGTRMPSRPQQYIDTWIMLERLANPMVPKTGLWSHIPTADQPTERARGAILGHTTGLGKTRQMFLVTAVLRLVYLCHLDVQEKPHRHITSIGTGPRDCPSEGRFGIRCACNRNGLSSRLIATLQLSQQHNFPHVFITGANLVDQAVEDANDLFHDEIMSPFPEDNGRVLPFVQLASLHGKSMQVTGGHKAIRPYKASIEFYRPNAPTVASKVVDLVSIAEMRKHKTGYQYTDDLTNEETALSESQLRAQIKHPWAIRYTIPGREVGKPLHLFFVSRSGISQQELNDNLRYANLQGLKVRRTFGTKVRQLTVKFGLGIQCGVVFHDEFHTVTDVAANFSKRLAGLVDRGGHTPFFLLSTASVVCSKLESLTAPLSLLYAGRNSCEIRKTLLAFELGISNIRKTWTNIVMARPDDDLDINKYPPFLHWVQEFGDFFRALVVRRDPFSTVMGSPITRPLPKFHHYTRRLDPSEEAVADYTACIQQLQGQLSEKERTYLSKAEAVTQEMLRVCFAGFAVYGRMQLASFFPVTLRPDAPVVPTVGEALYRIIGPVLNRRQQPLASDIENKTQVWRAWHPPVFHKIKVQGPSAPALGATRTRSAAPATAAASGAGVADAGSSYKETIGKITSLAKPIRKCPRVAEIYDIITRQVRRHLLPALDRNAGAKPPPWPLNGIVMVDTPAMAFYVAVALQLRDEEEEEKDPLINSSDPSRPRIRVMFVPAASHTKEDLRTLAVHWLRRTAPCEEDPDVCKVLVTTFMAAGTGLDGLQTSLSYIIYPLAPLSATAEEQADGRIHRTGQQYETAKYTITISGDPYDMLRSFARVKLAIRDGENNISIPLINELLGPAGGS